MGGAAVCAGCRLAEEAEAEDGGSQPHESNPLTQRVRSMETNGCIPSSERQAFLFPVPQMSQAASFSVTDVHGITRVAPARAGADVAVKAPVTPPVSQGETCGRK